MLLMLNSFPLPIAVGAEAPFRADWLNPVRFRALQPSAHDADALATSCWICRFIYDDGLATLGLDGGGQVALDSSWQSTDVELFLSIADRAIVELLRPTTDEVFNRMRSPNSEALGATEEAVKYRLSIDGYVAGRILLHSANRRLHWPPSASERWRSEIMNHRSHLATFPFRSAGARLHIRRVTARVQRVNNRDLMAEGLSMFRSALSDAVAERVLQHRDCG
jgi:hypothetical protein